MRTTPDNLVAILVEKQAVDEIYQLKTSKLDDRFKQLIEKRGAEIAHLAQRVGVLTIEDAVLAGALVHMLGTIAKAGNDPYAAGLVAQWQDDGQRFCRKRRQKAGVSVTSTATPSIEAPSGVERAVADLDAMPPVDAPVAAVLEAVPEPEVSTAPIITSVELTITLEGPSILVPLIDMAIPGRSGDMSADCDVVMAARAPETVSDADQGLDQAVPATPVSDDQLVDGDAPAATKSPVDESAAAILSDEAMPITVKVGPPGVSRTSDDSRTAGPSVPHQSRRSSSQGFVRPNLKGATAPPPGN